MLIERNSMCPQVENVAAYIAHHHITKHLVIDNCSVSNNYVMTMVTNSNYTGSPKDMVNQVYNSSFLAILRKSPNKTPAHFNQHHRFIFNFVLKAANLVYQVRSKNTKRLIWWICEPTKNVA
jgi:hypothetical protein